MCAQLQSKDVGAGSGQLFHSTILNSFSYYSSCPFVHAGPMIPSTNFLVVNPPPPFSPFHCSKSSFNPTHWVGSPLDFCGFKGGSFHQTSPLTETQNAPPPCCEGIALGGTTTGGLLWEGESIKNHTPQKSRQEPSHWNATKKKTSSSATIQTILRIYKWHLGGLERLSITHCVLGTCISITVFQY